MVVISYRERNCKFLSGEVFTYKSKLYRGGRCCVMRFVRLTLLTGRTFSRGNDDLFKKKKKNHDFSRNGIRIGKKSIKYRRRTNRYFSRESIEPMSPHRASYATRTTDASLQYRTAKKPVHVVTLRVRCFERTRRN